MPEEIFELVTEIFTSGADSAAGEMAAVAEGSEAVIAGIDVDVEGDDTIGRRVINVAPHVEPLGSIKTSENDEEYDDQQDSVDYGEQLFEA